MNPKPHQFEIPLFEESDGGSREQFASSDSKASFQTKSSSDGVSLEFDHLAKREVLAPLGKLALEEGDELPDPLESSSQLLDLGFIRKLDPRLAALREQLGEAGWRDRIEEALEREATLNQLDASLATGMNLVEALRALDVHSKPSTIPVWRKRYNDHGLLGLVNRSGVIARQRRPDPIPSPLNIVSRGNKPISFVKWAGSKRTVMPLLLKRMPKNFNRYFDPMVGAGTVFLSLKPKTAIIGDLNAELLNCWEIIRDRVEELLTALDEHQNTYKHYIAVRAQCPEELEPVERAARTIFLNKTCYNGLYRVNRKGRFNVPYGYIDKANWRDRETLLRISIQLEGVQLRRGDFEENLRGASAGDLVYLDPPYLAPKKLRRTFHSYQPESFDEEKHLRLASLFRTLDARGCHLVLSNSDVPLVHELYRGYNIEVLTTRRNVNANAQNRAGWTEVLIDNIRG